MSLKAFHVVFVIASILLAFGFGGWEIKSYSDFGQRLDLMFGVGSAIVGLVLIGYFRYVLKKLKDISYL
jgi:chromate transport protein ChrA